MVQAVIVHDFGNHVSGCKKACKSVISILILRVSTKAGVDLCPLSLSAHHQGGDSVTSTVWSARNEACLSFLRLVPISASTSQTSTGHRRFGEVGQGAAPLFLRGTDGTHLVGRLVGMAESRLDRVLRIGWAHHVATIGCESSASKRLRRSCRHEQADATTPNLGAMETDADGRVVYVDLHAAEQDDRFAVLRASLAANRPPERVLERLPPINRGRLLVEVEEDATLALFGSWLRAVVTYSPMLRQMLEPLGPRLRLLGAQWIVPRATEYEPRILAQTPHTDVDTKGEVISIAIHVDGCEMGTLIDAKARIDADGRVLGGGGFGRAATSAFAYDTGAVHGGPGVAHVEGPYPRYFVQRVFFLVSSHELAPDRIAQHRRDNGLRGVADLVV